MSAKDPAKTGLAKVDAINDNFPIIDIMLGPKA
jgi:hypothetical protein